MLPPLFDTSSNNKIWHITTCIVTQLQKKERKHNLTHNETLVFSDNSFHLWKWFSKGIVLFENTYSDNAYSNILIIIHVLQNGTRWLPFVTVVEDNLFFPHHLQIPYGLALLDILFLRANNLSALHVPTGGGRRMWNSPKMVVYKLRDLPSVIKNTVLWGEGFSAMDQ